MLVSEIGVSNAGFTVVMKPSPSASVTQDERIGYARISTVAQTLDRQNIALEAAGVTKTFSDIMSGALDRPRRLSGNSRRCLRIRRIRLRRLWHVARSGEASDQL